MTFSDKPETVGFIMTDVEPYVHKKTGNVYYKLLTKQPVFDCTNAHDGEEVVLYTRDGMLFVRECKEFEVKFRPAVSLNKSKVSKNVIKIV